MHAVRATCQSDIGARVHQDLAVPGYSQYGSHQTIQVASGELLGANLNHLHTVAAGAGGHIERIGNAVTPHRMRSPALGNSTTQSFTPLYLSIAPAGNSTAISPENSRRTRSGFSMVRRSAA